MSSHSQPSKPRQNNSGPRDKAAKRKGRNSRKDMRPEKPVEIAQPKIKRRPEWQVIREAGAERQADALAGLEAARAAAANHHVEISVSMISLSRRAKPTVSHVKFVKDGRVFAHYHPVVGRLFFGRKGKVADEGRFATVEEATTRVLAYDNANRRAAKGSIARYIRTKN